MKLIDSKGRLFGKVSVIDIIIVLSISSLIAVMLLNVLKKDSAPVSSVNDSEYTATLKVYNLYKPYTQPFKVGDCIYSSAGTLIGEVVNVEEKAAYSKMRLADGTFKDFNFGTFVDYYVTVKGAGVLSDAGMKADGVFSLIPNSNITVSSRLYYGYAVVLSVEKNN